MLEARGGEPRAAGGGVTLPGTGSLVSLLVTGEDIGGRFALVESVEGRGCEPPLHVHHREDELVYVLEGRVRFHLEGERIGCQAGECVLLPRGREHTYSIESERARLLVMLTPAGLEGYYRELGQPADGQGGYQEAERLLVVAARYGVDIIGPPPIPGGARRCPARGRDADAAAAAAADQAGISRHPLLGPDRRRAPAQRRPVVQRKG